MADAVAAIGLTVIALVTAAAALNVARRTVPVSARGTNSRAHQEVELGRFFLDKFSGPDALLAIGHFETAGTLDPGNARAYAGLAEAYNQLGSVFIGSRPPASVRQPALRAALRAIELDPSLAEAYAALGYTAMHEFAWTEAADALHRAIEIDPGYVPAHQAYAGYLSTQCRFPEAIAEARRGLELEPASVRARHTLAWMLYFDRQYDAALQELQTILRMDPTYALGQFRLGQVLLLMRRFDDAVEPLQRAVEQTRGAPAAVGLLAMAYAGGGRAGDAQRILHELEQRSANGYVPPGALLLAYLAVGDKPRAIDMIARGFDERDNYEVNIAADPLMDALRDDPRFQSLCRRVMLGTRLPRADVRKPLLSADSR